MNVRGALREALEGLAAAQVPSASTTAEVLLLYVLERDRAFLYAHPEAELSLEQERAFRHLVRERATGRPTQYLTGRQEFWGLALRVEPGVFIPRPETEHVVEVTLQVVRERLRKPEARIVDVGTGTGCIALALASELPEAEIIATDISEAALAVARRNAEELNLAGRVQFLKSNLLEAFLASGHESRVTSYESLFDLVVSNPPYVSPSEAAQLPREVREHEPAQALFSPGEGLELTRRLIEQAAVVLAPGRSPQPSAVLSGPGFSPAEEGERKSGALAPEGQEGPVPPPAGWLVLELGYQMAGRVRALLGDAWTNVAITDDLRGIPRVLAAQKQQ